MATESFTAKAPAFTPIQPMGTLSDADIGLPGEVLGTLSDADIGIPTAATNVPAAAAQASPGAGEPLGTLTDAQIGGAPQNWLTTAGQALFRGISEAGQEGAATATGHAFDEPTAAPAGPPDQTQQALDAGLFSSQGFLPNVLYGLGHSVPSVAGGLLGAGAASAVAPEAGPLAPIAGGFFGASLGSALPAVRRAYVEARQSGLDPDAAASQAAKIAGVEGLIGGLSAAFGGAGKLFESQFMRGVPGLVVRPNPGEIIGRAATSLPGQALVTQPAIAMAGQRIEGGITGHDPSAPDLAATYVESLVPGAVTAAAHGARLGIGRPGGPDATQPEGRSAPAAPAALSAPKGTLSDAQVGVPSAPAGREPIMGPPPANARGAQGAAVTPVQPPPVTSPVPGAPANDQPATAVQPGPAAPAVAPGTPAGSGSDAATVQPGGLPPGLAGSGGYSPSGSPGAGAVAPNEPGSVQLGTLTDADIGLPAGTEPAQSQPGLPVGQPAGPLAPNGQPEHGGSPLPVDAAASQLGTLTDAEVGIPAQSSPGTANLLGPFGPEENAVATGRAAAGLNQAEPGAALRDATQVSSSPHTTDRPTYNTSAVARDIGVPEPDLFANKPPAMQAAVLRQALAQKYGLAGVDIGEGADPKQTVDQLIDAHHGLQHMAHVLGVPSEAMGLRGRVRLWAGPAGHPRVGTALGVYRPADRSISIPGRSNSFAHEWTHALDHALADAMVTPNRRTLMSLSPDHWITHQPNTTQEAFAHVMAAMYGEDADRALTYMQAQARAAQAPTPANARALAAARQAFQTSDFLRRTQSVPGPFGAYLSQPYELLARSHEAYIGSQIAQHGGALDGAPFIAKSERDYLSEADRHLSVAYPKGTDRARIFDAWRELHNQLRADAFYIPGQAAARPADPLDGLSPERWGQWRDAARNPQLAATERAMDHTVRQAQRQGYRLADALRTIGFNPADGSDPGYLTAWQRAVEATAGFVGSPRWQLNIVHDRLVRAAPRAAPIIRSLIDQLATAPGSGRPIRQTFSEHVSQASNRDNNAYAKIVRARQIPTNLVPAQHELIHRALTQANWATGLAPHVRRAIESFTLHRLSAADQASARAAVMRQLPDNTPDNVKSFAADLRFFFDRKLYEMRQAGLDVSAEPGYFPRIMDDHRVYADPDSFTRDAARAYAIASDRETEQDADAMRRHIVQAEPELSQVDRNLIETAVNQEARRRQAVGLPATTAAHVLPDAQLRALVHEAWGRVAANGWREAIILGHATSFDTRGPRGDMLRSRTLPKEADDILRRWYVIDPHAVVPDYAHKVNRKIAFVQRFGQAGEHIDQAIADAVYAGMRPEDGHTVRRLVEQITGAPVGSDDRYRSKGMVRALEGVHAYATMALLPRVIWSSLTEPMTTLLRTGSVGATYQAWAQLGRQLVRSGEGARIKEVAEFVGAVVSGHYDAVNAGRTGATYTDSQSLGPMMQNYFRATGIAQLTNVQRQGAVAGAAYYLHHLTSTIRGSAPTGSFAAARAMDRAQFELRELGIPDAEQSRFAEWLHGLGRGYSVPDIAQLQGDPMGQLWTNAALRFTNQTNQAPYKEERASIANDPFGRLITGLMSFSYAFQNNILDRAMGVYEHALHSANDYAAQTNGSRAALRMRTRTAMVMKALGAVSGTVAAALLATTIRELVFNGAAWDEHEKNGDLMDWLLGLTIPRVGLNGTIDPIVQAIESIRYQASLNSLVTGAQGNYILDNLQKVLGAVVRRSPNTNTSTYNGIVGLYNLTVAPAVALGSTMLYHAPFAGARIAGAAAMQKLTSPGMADSVATALVGKKGTEAYDPEHPYDPNNPPEPRESTAHPPEATSGLTTGPLGFIDDALPLVARNWRNIPMIGRVAAGLAGAGYVGSKVLGEIHRYDGGKPPAERQPQQ